MVTRREREQTFTPAPGQLPRHRAAPVVADQVETIVTERRRQPEHVTHERVTGVGLDGRRPGAGRVTPLVRRGHAVARVGQRTDLVAPRPRRLGEPVQQQHQFSVVRPGEAHVEDQLAPVRVVDGDRGGVGRGHDEGAALRRRKNFSRLGSWSISCANSAGVIRSAATGTTSATRRRSL